MKRRRSNTLVAISSAAVMSVYAAGFMRTRAAAERLEQSSRARIPVIPAPAPVVPEPAAKISQPSPEELPKTAPAPKLQLQAQQKAIVEPETGRRDIAVAITSNKPEKLDEPAAAKPETVTISTPASTTTTAAAPVATPSTPTPAAEPQSPSAEMLLGGTELKNGTFLGWGTSRHGDIQASVTIFSGRITAVSIAQCRTRYSCDVIAHLPAKVLRDQTPEKINNVSGATQSVDAFYYAVIDAINKAK